MKSSEKKYFPMFVDLTDKKVVVAGAGTIAKRRIRAMLEFTEHLTVIAPEVNPELRTLEEQGKLTVLRKAYEREDLYDAALVIAATNDKKTNEDIYAACKCLGILQNRTVTSRSLRIAACCPVCKNFYKHMPSIF